MRIVFDTSSFVTAIRSSDGAAGALLQMIFSGQVVPLMDLKLGLEYRDVSLRGEHLRATPLSRAEVLELVEAIEAFAEPVEVVLKKRPMSPDPNDDMVLDIALNGHADAVVTNNTKHFAAAKRKFGIAVLTPSEILERMRRGAHNAD